MSYFTRALEELKPNSEWAVTGDQYSRLTWLDKNQTKPTEEELNNKINAGGSSQKLILFKRGKAISQAPIIIGTNQLPKDEIKFSPKLKLRD